MSTPTSTLRRLRLVAMLAVLVAGCGNSAPTTPVSAAPASAPPSPAASVRPSVTPSASPTQSPSPIPSALTSDLTKRPFTVLVLGGDNGFRTDAVIVAGIDPVNKTVGFASLPRDTIDVPVPGGGIFRGQKVNAFYNYAAADPKKFPQGPGRATADMMQELLGIRIDFYAATTFDGFMNLVNAMGGVRVVVPETVIDPYYQVTSTQIGIRFNAGAQVMNGSRALIYSRTRQGDSDFARSRRQQVFLAAAGTQVLGRQALLAALLKAKSNLVTDFPLAQVPALLLAIETVPAAGITSGLVLGPTRYSSTTPCACGYALEPDIAAMHQAAARLFPWAVIAP